MKKQNVLFVISDRSIRDKIAWSDFEQALPGPKGEGQEPVVMTGV